MTRQIVIKLNEKKFKPIIERIKPNMVSKSHSELIGLCLWCYYIFTTEKVPELGNKTREEFLNERMDMPRNEAIISILKNYNIFIQGKKFSHQW